MDIYKGDIVYAFEYKNRNNIKSFDDLIKIKVDTVDNDGKTIIVSGETMVGDNIVINSNNVPDRSSGIVMYKKENDILLKKNKKYYIGYSRKKKGFIKDVKEYDDEKLMCLYLCLEIDNNASAKVKITDICFPSIEEVNEFIELLKITHAQLFDDRITIKINGEDNTFFNYEVYYKEKLITSDGHKRLFNYACKVKNSINETSYDYNKIFSMKNAGFEISYAKV